MKKQEMSGSNSQLMKNIIVAFRPRPWSWRWWKGQLNKLWSGLRIMIIFYYVIYGLRAIEDVAKKRIKAMSDRTKKILYSIYIGTMILWELSGVAFRWFIDEDLYKEIKESKLAIVAIFLNFGVCLVFLCFLMIKPINYWFIGFLIYQLLRGLAFIGMCNFKKQIEQQEKKSDVIRRRIIRAEDYFEEIDNE